MPNPLAAFSTATAPQASPRSENPLAAFSTASAAPQPPMAGPAEPDRSAGEYLGEMVGNIPSSAGQVASDLWQAISSPVDTAKAIGGAAVGGVQHAKDALGIPTMDAFGDHRDAASAVADFYGQRYGGTDEIADTFREDPVGALLDVGGVVAGGAGAAARAPGVAGQIARGISRADPVAAAGRGVAQAVKGRLPTTPSNKQFVADAPTPEQLREKADSLYEAAEKSGVKFKADYFEKFADSTLSRLVDEGADSILTPKLSRVADVLDQSRGKAPSIKEMAILRKQFGLAAGSADLAEARLGSIAIDLLDDFVEGSGSSVGGTLSEARAIWGRLKKSEIIDKAIESASAAQSGIEAGLRNEFRSLWKARGSKKMRGFTDAELSAIKAVAQGNMTSNVLRRIGSLGGGLDQGRNMMNLMAGVGGGAMVGGPIGAAAVPLAGYAAARASKAGTQKRASLARAIAARGETPGQATAAGLPTALQIFLEQGAARRYPQGAAPVAAPVAIGIQRAEDPKRRR